MKRNKELLIAFLSLALASGSITAESYPRPLPKEVVIVMRMVMLPAIDDAFFSKYWGKDGLIISFRGARGVRASTSELYIDTLGLKSGHLGLGDIGGWSSVVADIPKNGRVRIRRLSIFPANNHYFQIVIPFNFEFVVPDGVNYVYLGTFEWSWTGVQFELTGVKKIDEFDAAQKVVRERYSPGAQLSRVPLIEIKE